jgi:hypothetical protein
MKKTKVFCIGFHKTGTSSLRVALERLGYSVAGYYQFSDLAKRQALTLADVEARAIEVASGMDAAQDSPWFILYRQLDRAFPGSKFIHVVRNRDSWIKSAVRDFGAHPNSIRKLIYGTTFPLGNEAAWLDRYDQHNREVPAYFAGRPDDFISLDLDRGEVNWGTVCHFLDEPQPNVPWPHANRHQVKSLKMKYHLLRTRLGFK